MFHHKEKFGQFLQIRAATILEDSKFSPWELINGRYWVHTWRLWAISNNANILPLGPYTLIP